MSNKLKSFIIIIGCLLFGLPILIFSQYLKLPFGINNAVIVFFAFILLNLSYLYIFKLQNELKVFWELRKLPFFLFGFLGGTFIALSPTLLSLLLGKLNFSEISFNSEITSSSIGLTLIIISWEELWFRGLFLNYCNRYLSSINLSIIIGLLFMLIHILNPEIDLFKTGPSLFFAGALLTILYFYYKTIWLPIGLHFGNNLSGTILKTANESDLLFGNESYIGTIILASLFFFYFIKTKKFISKR